RAQVSAGPGVVCTVETRPEGEFVRCVSCHGLYEPAQPGTSADPGEGCPACGETRWLAERVPVEESSPAETA
ncbi:MAG: hypothetical protein QOG93_85, partial [Gaiellaceae bacterium]|nr:hypothetical protein [Gaiellaceae bacterium]